MGLSASQARLLSITRRLNNNELQSEFIANSKIQLSARNVAASEKYINALEATRFDYVSYGDNGIQEVSTLTFNNMNTYGALKNQYALFNANGQILVNKEDAKNFTNSNTLADFLDKYNLITNNENDPLYQAQYTAWEKEHDDWENNHAAQEQAALTEWESKQGEEYNNDHKAWEERKNYFENWTNPSYDDNQKIYEEYTSATADGSLYTQFSNLVGTHDAPQNTSSGGAGACYAHALNGDTTCYRHVLSHLVDYDTTRTTGNISKDTYKTSTGVDHTLLNAEGAMGTQADFNPISEAISKKYSNGEYVFLCDGDDDLSNEDIALTKIITEKSAQISAKIIEINTLQDELRVKQNEKTNLTNEYLTLTDELTILNDALTAGTAPGAENPLTNADILAINQEINFKKDEIAAKEIEISNKQDEIDAKQTEIATKNQELIALEKEKAEAEEKKTNTNKLKEAWDNYNTLVAGSAAQQAIDAAQAKIDSINAEITDFDAQITDISSQITTKEVRFADLGVQISTANTEIATAQTAYDTAIASGDSAAAATALSQLNSKKETKRLLEEEQTQIQAELSELYVQKSTAETGKADANTRLAAAQTELTDAQATLGTESADITAARAEVDKWTLLSDYKLVTDYSGNTTYELKSLKEKAIDLDYALSIGTLTSSEILPTLINFTDGDMQMLSMIAPVKPFFDETEPQLSDYLQNPPDFSISEPQPPTQQSGNIVDAEKAQWYINLWHAMCGSEQPEKLNQKYNDEFSITYYQLNQPVATKEQFLSSNGCNNFAVIDYENAADSTWLQHSIENGLLTMRQATLRTNNEITWQGLEFSSTSDIKEVENKEKIALAEAEYNKTLQEIQMEDKKLDQQTQKLDTEHSALLKEVDSIQNVMSKNVERSFAAFS